MGVHLKEKAAFLRLTVFYIGDPDAIHIFLNWI